MASQTCRLHLPEIRPATADDSRTLAELRYEFRSAIKPAAESAADFIARCERWMRSRLRVDGDWRAWLALGDDGALGTVWLHRIDKLPNPVGEGEAIGYITSFYVKPLGRNAGIGTELLRTALAAADDWRCDYVILWPTPRSRGLYERHGFTARDTVLVRVAAG